MSIDPRQLPLDPAFDEAGARGQALVPAQLTPTAIRQRFAGSHGWVPELRSDARLFTEAARAPTPAAVLVALIEHGGWLSVLLTHRAQHLQAHAGQIAFPGGRIETRDAGPVAAALRETYEETGLVVERIEILGTLPRYLTASHFDVTPVVGLVAGPVQLALDAGEVQDAFEVPLSFLMDPRHHQRRVVEESSGTRRFVYTMLYEDDASRERLIWGTTAAILRNLYGFLGGLH